jgi:NAD(P)-dependent dehydrogenase (short-subunit alcohol dehydrogenase family)
MTGTSLRGKIALVTGGASGIGRACAIALAHEGAVLVMTDLDMAGIAETVGAIIAAGGTAEAVRADAADVAQTSAAVSHVLVRHGRLDIAVNNAGIITPFRLAGDITDDEWDRQIAINLSGVRHAMRFELAAMAAQASGSIINISSGSGLKGLPGGAAYTAAKHGVLGLTKAAALDYGELGIRINAICPGYIDTPIHAPRAAEGRTRNIADMVPLGRAGRADEVADAALWLASERASFVTGIALPVDGGYSAG